MSDLQITIDQLKQANKKLASDYEMKMGDKNSCEESLKDKISELNSRISELIRENERIKGDLNVKLLEEVQKVEMK